MRSAILAAAACLAGAQTWYGEYLNERKVAPSARHTTNATSRRAGIAPDGGDPGLINLFSMEPNGFILSDKAPIKTSDREYPKTGAALPWVMLSLRTLCNYDLPPQAHSIALGTRRLASLRRAFRHEGLKMRCIPWIARRVPSSLRCVTKGDVLGRIAVLSRVVSSYAQHTAPPGIFFDNLVFDWAHEDLYYVTFNTADRRSSIVKLDALTGNVSYVYDITKDTAAGAVFPGEVSLCSQLQELYVGIDAANGEDLDFILRYDLSGPTPVLKAAIPLLFPLPTATFAICNATDLQALYANTIQVDGFDKETALLGDVIRADKTGLFYPVARGDLPSFNRRGGAAPKYFNGAISEFGGEFIIPAYEPFEPGLFPLPAGLIWNVKFSDGPTVETLTPIDYFLVGASGVPGK